MILFLVFLAVFSKIPDYLDPFKIEPPGPHGYKYTEEQLKPQKLNSNPYEHSGYFKVNDDYDGNLFYIFFEAQNGNKSAPIIMWLQGGPGSSSLLGCFAEMGPYSVDPHNLNIQKRAHSWNEKFHMLFVDNPVGTGFSYVEEGGYVETEEEVGDQLYIFLTKFFEEYSQFKDNDFYVFGESYGGKYVPAISHKIQSEGYKVNLRGLGIGDGLTNPEIQFATYKEWAFTSGCTDMNSLDAIESNQNAAVEAIKNEDWQSALDHWDHVLTIIDNDSKEELNLYDIRLHEDYDFSHIAKYLDLNATKTLMHTTGHTWGETGDKVGDHLALDMPKSVLPWFVDLVNDERLKVVIYSGQWDLIVPTSSTVEGFLWEMDWDHKKDFHAAARNVWKNGDDFCGWMRKSNGLYAVIVANAGHLSPMDQIEATQDMVTRFIHGW